MLNKENYVPWPSCLLRYAKSRPNEKLIYNSIINGPYVRRMIPKPSDANREVRVNETFPVQTYDELTEKEYKQVEADDQAIQTILLGLPEDIYAAVDSCETAQEIWLRVQQMMKGSDIRIQEKRLSCLMNKKVQNVRNQVVQNVVQNLGVQNVENQNGLIVVLGIANQNPNMNGNVVVAWAEGNEIWNNKFDLMAAAANLDEIEKVNENCILTANLQRASTSSTQTDKALVYDSDRSLKVHNYNNCYDNEIFNMFTQEEQYTELLEPIHEPHQVQHNDSNVISEVFSMEQDGGTVDQHLITAEETSAYFNSLYNNLAMEVEKEKSIVSSLLEEKKKLKSGFKIREDELLDKKIQLENKIKKLDNILVKTGQSIQMMHMLSPKPDSFYHTEQKMARGYQNLFYLKEAQQKQQNLYNGKVILGKHDSPAVYDSKETLQLAQESRLKMKQLNKEIKPTNYTKINHLLGVFVSQTAKSREESYVLNTSKTANDSKSISILNEEFSDDATPSVARKVLNEVKSVDNTTKTKRLKPRSNTKNDRVPSASKNSCSSLLPSKMYPLMAVVALHIGLIKTNSLIAINKKTLQLAQESRDKMKQMNKEIKPANSTKINHLSRVFVSQTALSREELYFSNNSKTANVSKSISILNEDLSDDTTPSVARKFLNEVKSTILTLQRVVKQRMTIETHNWSSSAHQELHKNQAQKKQQSLYDGKMLLDKHDPPVVHDSEEILQLAQESHDKMKQMNKEIKPANYTKINHLSGVFVPQKALSLEELYFSNNSKTTNVSKSFLIPNEDLSDNTTPSVARKFLNEEAAKFVGDFKSLAKEADDSLAKHKAMELDNERLLKVVVSQDVMNIVQKESVVDTSDLQTELERMKE
nr:hypothetical protein [Tanacetum cinerariifolium]